MSFLVLSICFFVSGAAGLIYEVVWTRWLGLVFGNTVLATSAVLAAYMGGLALGSYVLGRLLDRRSARTGLRVYGLLEGGVGLYGLLTPLLFPVVEHLYVLVYRELQPFPGAFNAARFVFGLVLLILPTALMGGTLPALSKFAVNREEEIGNRVGFLYALNTCGAVVGTMLAGYVLLPLLGLRASIFTAVAGNIAIALFVTVAARRVVTTQPVDRQPQGDAAEPPRLSSVAVAVLCAIGASGFVSLVYEVVWTRVLSMLIGSSVYAFTAMLTAFLTGLALGSGWCAKYLARTADDGDARVRRHRWIVAFGFVEAGIGLLAISLVPVFGAFPYWLPRIAAFFSQASGSTHQFAATGALALQLFTCFLTMIGPTTLMGATFPLAAALYTEDSEHVSAGIGNVYAVNTVGAILGSMAAALVLIPLVGMRVSLLTAALLNLAIAAALFRAGSRFETGTAMPETRRRRLAFAMLAAGVVGALIVPSWQKQVLTAGVYRYGARYIDAYRRRDVKRRPRLLFYDEGMNCTVSVMRDRQGIWLAVNGKFDASTTPHDMDTQLLLGHLPMLLHKASTTDDNPADVFIIGCGSGVTAASVGEYHVGRIDCAEIEPAVAAAARRCFAGVNHGIFDDPRFHLIADDGRHQLLATARKYDVIISEPSSLWMSGIANLYTREQYRLCRSRLRPHGIMCQWLQAYQILPSDMRLVMRTFRSVFPHTTVWCSTTGDLLLIGSRDEMPLSFPRLTQCINDNPRIRADLAYMDLVPPATLFTCFVTDEAGVRDYAGSGPLHTDDWPRLEFSAPLTMYTSYRGLHYRDLVADRHVDLPPVRGFAAAELQDRRLQPALARAYARKGIRHPAAFMTQTNVRLSGEPHRRERA